MFYTLWHDMCKFTFINFKPKKMKTNTYINKLKKGLVTICSTLFITTGSFTQPNPDVYRNDEMASMARLEVLMNGTEQSIRFVAPDVEASEGTEAQVRLNNLAESTEVSLKYQAPAVEETSEIAPELERLDKLAHMTESSIRYAVPATEEIEVTPELERLDLLADHIEKSLVFKAPSVEDAPDYENNTGEATEIMLADKNN